MIRETRDGVALGKVIGDNEKPGLCGVTGKKTERVKHAGNGRVESLRCSR